MFRRPPRKIRGLNPGPLLFVEHKDFVWGLIASPGESEVGEHLLSLLAGGREILSPADSSPKAPEVPGLCRGCARKSEWEGPTFAAASPPLLCADGTE